MGERVSMSQASRFAGVDRKTLRRWIDDGRLVAENHIDERGRFSRLVDLDRVRELAKGIKTGRPPQEGRG